MAENILRDGARAEISHFTGAIVTQGRTVLGGPTVFEVIDGQQRLITFQIILAAIRNVCAVNFPRIADDIKRHTHNLGRHTAGDAKFKLLPSKPDRDAFKSLIERGDGQDGVLKNAFDFFGAKIKRFVDGEESKADALLISVMEGFEIVQIAVEDKDEPETIFQSLNGRAQHLWQFDLLRNDLFLRMRQTEPGKKDELYEQYWEYFESPEWGEDVVVGRKSMPLSELFLWHFLSAKSVKATLASLFHDYCRYRKHPHPDARGIESELGELRNHAEHYKYIVQNEASGKNMQLYDILDITPRRPFFLYLLTDSGLSAEQCEYVFKALESYTVRRGLSEKYPFNHLNIYFGSIIEKLRSHPLLPVVTPSLVLQELGDSKARTDRWTSDKDREFDDALSGAGGWSERNSNDTRMARYILYRMENYLRQQDRFAEEDNASFSFQSLELEHILPRNWRKNWLLPSSPKPVRYEDIISFDYKKEHADWGKICPAEGEEDIALKDMSYVGALEIARERDALLHSLGNLTLLTKPMNASVSDSTFSKKKEELKNHSVLFLNKNVCCCEDWDISQIKERTKKLRDIFRKIWPDAQWFLDNIPGE